MKLKFLMVPFLFMCLVTTHAQTADEIIAKYFENTGGIAKWRTVEGVKISAKISQGAMEIPLIIIQLKDGRQSTSVSFQGIEIRQNVFDGTVLWSTNLTTMKLEKSDAETTETFKSGQTDFPDPFLDYKSKGHKIELMGKETIDGAETYKIKFIKKSGSRAWWCRR